MTRLRLTICSVLESLYDDTIDMVILPAQAGQMGVMPRHTPCLVKLKAGFVRIQQQGQDIDQVYVSGGYAAVHPTHVEVLADFAVRTQASEAQAAQLAKESAQHARDAHGIPVDDFDRAYMSLMRQMHAIKPLPKRFG